MFNTQQNAFGFGLGMGLGLGAGAMSPFGGGFGGFPVGGFGFNPLLGALQQTLMMMQLMQLLQMIMQALGQGQNNCGGCGSCGRCGNGGFNPGCCNQMGNLLGMPGLNNGGFGVPWNSGFPTLPNYPYSSGGYQHDPFAHGGSIPNAPVGNAGTGGPAGQAAVNWALSQEGVSESRNPDTVRGYSQGRWEAWCAHFVSSAFERGAGGSPFGHQASVQGILNWGRNNPGHFLSADQARQNPSAVRPGDIVIWKQNGKSHTGLVVGMNPNGTYRTIEGNTSNRVAQRSYTLNDRQLTGFVRADGTF